MQLYVSEYDNNSISNSNNSNAYGICDTMKAESSLNINEKHALALCELIAKNGDEFAKKKVANCSNAEEAMKGLKNIRALRLSKSKLKEIPKGISLLENLTALDLGTNELADISDEIGSLSKLKTLSLNGNPLTELPKFILEKKLTNLKSLGLNLTKVTRLPYQLKDIISSRLPMTEWYSMKEAK